MLKAIKRALAGAQEEPRAASTHERRQLQIAVAMLLHEARRADYNVARMSDVVVEPLGALERAHPLARRIACAVLASACFFGGCRAPRSRPPTPIGVEACAEFAEAVRLSRRADPDRPALRAEIRRALQRALAAEPGWVAPRSSGFCSVGIPSPRLTP